MIKYFFILVSGCIFCSCSSLIIREPATSFLEKPIQRKYIEGETLKYRIQMSHVYDGKETSTYDAIATGIVKKDQQGSFFEEFQWTSILDESLIIRKSSALQKAGEHIYLNTAIASSWGKGQDCLDFDVSLASVDQNKKIAEIIVSHLPPSKICITPAAPWMYEQITESPNNWYNIEKEANNWLASAGKETFEVHQVIDIVSGKTLRATMDNPVEFQSRVCKDEKLLNCSKPTVHKIVRKLKLTLMQD